ncbi:hypothetical protein JMJ55_06825 [Belnapia sp. T6]|uniref:HNH endonuclease 5 domain-containing protein n=1 Tax=Belnapia mucosa TaxID=2804532 RepID=A0ABS1V1P5_9PROT|nr:HNH endonuclease [Belnapia mucosa]MBL6455031.1 hypothetical protein [Belnapia mucosa]
MSLPAPIFPPVGVCIYCRSDGGAEGLSREHLFPYGLGGNYVLPEASCAACADVTKRFEQVCLRQMFGAVRAQLGYPTRRKQERPNEFPMVRVKSEAEERISVVISEHPTVLILFVFEPPGLLRGQSGIKVFAYNAVWVSDITGSAFEKAKGVGSELPLVSHHHDMFAFARMIAKIAHGLAVARFGINSFEPVLTKLILGEENYAPDVIGGVAENGFHAIPDRVDFEFTCYFSLFNLGDTIYLVADIRLFAYLGAPVYRVVVGKVRHGVKDGSPTAS